VIPGYKTPYLQAGNIGNFPELKDNIPSIVDKCSDHVQYATGGNPKPPNHVYWIHGEAYHTPTSGTQ